MTDRPLTLPEPRAAHLIERAAARMAGLHALATPADAPATAPGPSTPPAPAAPAAAAAEPSWQLPALPDPALPDLPLTLLEAAGLVVGRSVRTRISEEFRIAVGRIARDSLAHGNAAPQGRLRNPLLLVTSARPGEGKTFTSLNLAAVMAQNGPRDVVLVDADGKHDGLSGLLGLHQHPGLHDLLTERADDPASLLVTTEIPRLRVLPAGGRVRSAGDARFNRPIGPLVAALADRFRECAVVLDAPPCLATSDASTLADEAGQVLLVVQAARTQRAEVESALDFVRACPNVTVLLNQVRQSNRQTFGSYDYLSSYQ